MRFAVKVEGDLAAAARQDEAALRNSLPRAVGEVGEAVKLQVRARVRSVLPGRTSGRHANAIRSTLYGPHSLNPAALVFSNLGRGKGTGFIDYLLPHVTGATIRPATRNALTIPLVGQRPRGGGLPAPVKEAIQALDDGTDPRLALIPAGPGKLLLVRRPAKGRGKGKSIALFIKQAKIRAKLSITDIEESAGTKLATEVDRTVTEVLVRQERRDNAGVR